MIDNGAIHMECKTIRHIISSEVETETNVSFENVLIAVNIQNLLTAMGHPQTPTIIKTNNSTTAGLLIKC